MRTGRTGGARLVHSLVVHAAATHSRGCSCMLRESIVVILDNGVSLNSPLEAPIEEESVHLEPDVHEQTDNKGGEQTVPPWAANGVGKTRGVVVAILLSVTPMLTTIFALPDDLVLTTIQLPYHENGPYPRCRNDERPQQQADIGPADRTVGKSEYLDTRHRAYPHANTTIDEPFGVNEVEVLAHS